MTPAVARYERNIDSSVLTNRDKVGRLAVRRVHLDLALAAKKPRVVNASAADNANIRAVIRH